MDEEPQQKYGRSTRHELTPEQKRRVAVVLGIVTAVAIIVVALAFLVATGELGLR